MRRRPGISGLQHGTAARVHYKNLGDHVQQVKLEHMRSQLEIFRKSLEEFALKHRDGVRQDPEFRAKFHAMCANVGVDPLASNKGVWAQLLGFGDFYYELGVQIVEACLATRAYNGGLMDLPALRRYVQRRRGSLADPISEDDILRAIGKLKALGSGFAVERIGKQALVRSVPGELNTDKNKLLELGQATGYISEQETRHKAGWTERRFDENIQALLREGLAMVDDSPGGGRLFWFPCLSSQLAAPNQPAGS
ncbi:hypothetical protein WJX74_004716 [Apatococcus lobatus]|uniref:Vacuolar protein sorting-associated protein n=1 Tax=Apatococcus lobatus TaxID=904363 RepID=A0AAW1SAV3_9CHLO